ncbi:MAG: nuclear transport factor 2 family protein [Microbacterium sp.]
MPHRLSPHAPTVLRDYYRILESGAAAYGDGAALRDLLTDHLDFTGPLAGHRPDATDGFLRGVAGFIATVQRIEILQDVHDETGSAVLYTATMPGGPMAFAEFFTFEDGRIATLHLHYNGPEYLEKGGR